MRILAIETAGPALGVAAVEAAPETVNPAPLRTIESERPFRHTENLLPTIARLLDELDWEAHTLSAVFVGAGPGSFTGLRIGMATAKGIALASDCPVFSVDSLEAIAETACSAIQAYSPRPAYIVPLIDARKGRLYAAFFRIGTSSEGEPALERASENLDVEPRALARLIEERQSSWLPAGRVDATVLHVYLPPDMIGAVGKAFHSAVPGVTRVGMRLLRDAAEDSPYAGPAYLRSGDVGKPRRKPDR